RRARLARQRGDEAEVARLLAAMRHDPWAPEEEDFAVRFATRRRRGRVAAPVSECRLTGPAPEAIERHALQLLTANGGRGWHLENLLPLGLAGLAFWDAIFAPVEGAFSHAYQLGPRDLFWPDFARVRRDLLDARVAELERPGALEARVRRTFAGKRGIGNHLVHWGVISEPLLDALLGNVSHALLARLAGHTVYNLHRLRAGFPDLLVIYGPGAWELVEVKGPADQLQPGQRVWLDALAQLEVPARVLRLKAPC
ncbi:MAG: VRR-NUC domain-containing protein, partial [Pseudomonadota bacterium]